jgi:hypothetical protein
VLDLVTIAKRPDQIETKQLDQLTGFFLAVYDQDGVEPTAPECM